MSLRSSPEAGRERITDEVGNDMRQFLRRKSPLPILTSSFVPIGFRLIKRKQLIRFPNADKNIAGVYFLFKKGTLIYVGSSRNVQSRITSHTKLKKIDFDRATFMDIAFPWYLSVEAAYIAEYMPAINIRHAPSGIDRDAIDQYLLKSDIQDEGLKR